MRIQRDSVRASRALAVIESDSPGLTFGLPCRRPAGHANISDKSPGFGRQNPANLSRLIIVQCSQVASDQALYTEKLVSRKSLDEMFTPFKDSGPGVGYAYGWNIGKRFDRPMTGHGGGINGFATNIIRFPADHVTVIVLSNNESARVPGIATTLAAIVFGAPYDIPVERKSITLPSATLDRYVGQYELAPNRIMTITNENGKLMAQATGQGKTELFAESETTFFPKVIEATLTFVKDAQGQVTGLVLRQGGRDNPAKKIK